MAVRITYDHKKIESKWQKYWEEERIFHAPDAVKGKDNYYLLVEFPYPSGNLHVGHWYAFAMPDIFARFQRMRGFNVLFPIGFDAFGLPAENAALQRGINPRAWTHDNIAYMREQLKHMGASFDGEREVVTCEPAYYRWTQWIFLEFLKAGLAYQAETPVNWCPSCKTVLANEQVKEGRCERCESAVEQRQMKQWLLKIREYAEELLHGLDALDWPEEIKQAQRNWIGRSEGALIKFQITNSKSQINSKPKVQNGETCVGVFTTRPDTLFGATYLVLAPEHPLIENHKLQIANYKQVEQYVAQSRRKTELERGQLQKEKTGVELKGVEAVNPATNEEIPIWIADYVLMGYATGAIMAVPAHDERDGEFAKKFGLPVRQVIQPVGTASVRPAPAGAENFYPLHEAYGGEGILMNSGDFNGLDSMTARGMIVDWLVKEGRGEKRIVYKLRDWLISRQRYWGCPIPVIYCRKCLENSKLKTQNSKLKEGFDYIEREGTRYAIISVPEDQLPVKLPELDDYKPRDDGKSPLAKAADWVKVACPQCGAGAERETDTLDTFVDSSWYFLRYTDPQNTKEFSAKEKLEAWMPVDLYSGGAEHTTMHLLYSRFWVKAMQRLKLIPWDEPYTRRMNRGIILGPDGQKMSKSHGNVVDPDREVALLGADTVRMYLAFIGPYAEVGAYPWSMNSIVGMRRFLERVWKEVEPHVTGIVKTDRADLEKRKERMLHQTIKKVTEDIGLFKFNTAISQLMTLLGQDCLAREDMETRREALEIFLKLLHPFAPHITEELWKEKMGHATLLAHEPWPQYDPALLEEENVTIVVQVNGKKRAVVTVSADAPEQEVRAVAEGLSDVVRRLEGKKVTKRVYVKGKLINLVTRG